MPDSSNPDIDNDIQKQSPTVQQPLPLAFVRGEAVVEKPEDLYIPPDALEVFLDAFEGPLDFLLYLIRRQKFDIVDLPVQQITLQYMEYVELMKDLKLELAAEYLVMAAILAEIKSRLLLPKRTDETQEDDDPRAELIRRLQEYETFKIAAVKLDEMPRMERDNFSVSITPAENIGNRIIQPDVDIKDLVFAFQKIVERAKAFEHHQIKKEVLSTRARMARILEILDDANERLVFSAFFDVTEGKSGVVVTFLAILELVKESLIELVQAQAWSQIYVKKVE